MSPPRHDHGAGGAAPPDLAPSFRPGWGVAARPPPQDPAPGQLFVNEIRSNSCPPQLSSPPPAFIKSPAPSEPWKPGGASSSRLNLPSSSVREGFGILGGLRPAWLRGGGEIPEYQLEQGEFGGLRVGFGALVLRGFEPDKTSSALFLCCV